MSEAAHLWKRRSDDELADSIELLLEDPDSLAYECDGLFEACAPRLDGAAWTVSAERLHWVTQLLIDRFGCRLPAVLERIDQLYGAVTGDGWGEEGIPPDVRVDGTVFRGYVAAVLTQVLHELDERSADAAGAVDPPADGAVQPLPTSPPQGPCGLDFEDEAAQPAPHGEDEPRCRVASRDNQQPGVDLPEEGWRWW
ncbi:unnamed protein product [Prorocentrum cordatum]|uniref:Uncharacterized protein n=1 Tax=Prorocentrum cordatum TaxID=2364126 RepID=A0ABN9XRM8_9DINO|nr:unnamed protein product [Polarella glacialis]